MAVRGTVDSGAGGTLVTSVTGTAAEVTATPTTGAVVVSLPTALTFTGKTVTGGTFAGSTLTTPSLGVATATSLALGGATIGTDALGVTGTSTLNFGTLGASSTTSGLSILGTWNDAGTTFKGALLVNVTQTAAASQSLLADFQVSGVTKISLSNTGRITSSDNITSGGNVVANATSNFSWSAGRAIITSPTAASLQLGQADLDTAPVAQTLRSQGALAGGTSNVAGANWTDIVSPGKGTGVGGSRIFQTAPAGSTGTAVNAAVTRLTLDGPGNVVAGSAALATNVTDGFLYIATCAGTPSGTPTTYTGRVALIYDTTAHQFWIYDSGWKQPKTPAGAAIVTWQ